MEPICQARTEQALFDGFGQFGLPEIDRLAVWLLGFAEEIGEPPLHPQALHDKPHRRAHCIFDDWAHCIQQRFAQRIANADVAHLWGGEAGLLRLRLRGRHRRHGCNRQDQSGHAESQSACDHYLFPHHQSPITSACNTPSAPMLARQPI